MSESADRGGRRPREAVLGGGDADGRRWTGQPRNSTRLLAPRGRMGGSGEPNGVRRGVSWGFYTWYEVGK